MTGTRSNDHLAKQGHKIKTLHNSKQMQSITQDTYASLQANNQSLYLCLTIYLSIQLSTIAFQVQFYELNPPSQSHTNPTTPYPHRCRLSTAMICGCLPPRTYAITPEQPLVPPSPSSHPTAHTQAYICISNLVGLPNLEEQPSISVLA